MGAAQELLRRPGSAQQRRIPRRLPGITRSTDDFAGKVEDCLRQWLARRGFAAAGAGLGPRSARLALSRPGGLRRRSRQRCSSAATSPSRRRSSGCARPAPSASAAPFLLIIGASGSGKSSLLRAGLLPRLTLPGTIPEIDLWRVAVVMPGPDPFAALAESLFADDGARAGAARGRVPHQGDARQAAGRRSRYGARAAARRARQGGRGAHGARPISSACARRGWRWRIDQAERLFAETDAAMRRRPSRS